MWPSISQLGGPVPTLTFQGWPRHLWFSPPSLLFATWGVQCPSSLFLGLSSATSSLHNFAIPQGNFHAFILPFSTYIVQKCSTFWKYFGFVFVFFYPNAICSPLTPQISIFGFFLAVNTSQKLLSWYTGLFLDILPELYVQSYISFLATLFFNFCNILNVVLLLLWTSLFFFLLSSLSPPIP